jgi:large subunit ribosomal protein L25
MEATLQAVKRGDTGKNEARRLRAAGRLPAVVYGGAPNAKRTEAVAVSVEPKALSRILHSDSGANTLITLQIEGDAEARVLVKEYQIDPISHHLLHADFYRVAMDKSITVTVPVVVKGEARGVKQQGGLLDFVHRQIEIECLPGNIPEHIEIDVSELLIHQGVRVRDLATVGRWTPISDPDTMLVHVVSPKAVEEPAPAEAAVAAPAEPEVIKKGKTEKEEEKG